MAEKEVNKLAFVNIPIVTANTDTPWAIPKGCVWFTMQCRTAVDVRVGLEPDKAASSHPPYLTMKSGTSWDERKFKIKVEGGQPVYFAAASAVVVEIVLGISTEEEM